MNTLREALQEYLALRRGLGFKMHNAALMLPRFVAFMEEQQAPSITIRLALAYFAQGRPAIHGKAVHGFTPCRSTARDAGRV